MAYSLFGSGTYNDANLKESTLCPPTLSRENTNVDQNRPSRSVLALKLSVLRPSNMPLSGGKV